MAKLQHRCFIQASPPPDTTRLTEAPKAAAGTLDISQRNAVEIRGSVDGPRTSVSFDSEVEQTAESPQATEDVPEVVVMNIDVNGKRIDVTENLQEDIVRLDGHDQILSKRDIESLITLCYELESKLATAPREPQNRLTPQEDLLYKISTFLSDAPVGIRLSELTSSKPEADLYSSETPSFRFNADPMLASIATTVLFESVEERGAEKCELARDAGNFRFVANGCQREGEDRARGKALFYHTCETKNRTLHWDTLAPRPKGCYRAFARTTGPKATVCRGRCGIGCGRYNGLGVYSKDCADHDHCVVQNGYSAPGCNDEFTETLNDVRYGKNNCNRNGAVRPRPFN